MVPDSKTYYRGSNPGDDRRIESPFASEELFVTTTPDNARTYGHRVEEISIKPGSKILKEGTREFSKIIGVPRVLQGLHNLGVDNYPEGLQLAVDLAKKAGYDVIEFERPTDVGTVILNPGVIITRREAKMDAFETLRQLRLAADKSAKMNMPKVPSISAKEYSKEEAKKIGNELGLSWDKYSLDEFHKGMNVELEHSDITKGDPYLTAKIAIAHLSEVSNYYTLLKKHVESED